MNSRRRSSINAKTNKKAVIDISSFLQDLNTVDSLCAYAYNYFILMYSYPTKKQINLVYFILFSFDLSELIYLLFRGKNFIHNNRIQVWTSFF